LAARAVSRVCQHASYSSRDGIFVIVDVTGLTIGFGAGAGFAGTAGATATTCRGTAFLGLSTPTGDPEAVAAAAWPSADAGRAFSLSKRLLSRSLGSAEVEGESCRGLRAERRSSAMGELGARAARASRSTRFWAAATAS
jgi:hypothetical protein